MVSVAPAVDANTDSTLPHTSPNVAPPQQQQHTAARQAQRRQPGEQRHISSSQPQRLAGVQPRQLGLPLLQLLQMPLLQ